MNSGTSQSILYYDCFSGICGDLNLGALIDLGVDQKYLLTELKKLMLDDWELNFSTCEKKGIYGTQAKVICHEQKHHRTVKDISVIISGSKLNQKVKNLSLKIFKKIAEAEAKVHNKAVEDVHFHEVGAIDSIIDIVGAAICLNYLGVDKVMSSSVELGGGFVKCAHGTLPVPAPATVEILKGIPVKTGAVPFETTTPTGAAILASTVDDFSDKIEFTIEKTAYGIGQRDTDIPNVLRVYLGKIHKYKSSKVCSELLIECNIDDMNPELYDFVFEKLFELGASDVFITPIIMKKSRPANKLSVLCKPELRDKVRNTIYKNTTTIGLREYTVEKDMLKRIVKTIQTKYGKIRIKEAYLDDQLISSKPEYEDCKALAIKHDVDINEIYRQL